VLRSLLPPSVVSDFILTLQKSHNNSKDFRRALRRRGIRMCIPPKRRPVTWQAKRGRPVVASRTDYQQRFKVERSFARLWQLPAFAHPLGTLEQGLSEFVHHGRAVHLPPSGLPAAQGVDLEQAVARAA
jgi:hypothetical protein